MISSEDSNGILPATLPLSAPATFPKVISPTAALPRATSTRDPHQGRKSRAPGRLPAWVVVLVTVVRRRATKALGHHTSSAAEFLSHTDALRQAKGIRLCPRSGHGSLEVEYRTGVARLRFRIVVTRLAFVRRQ